GIEEAEYLKNRKGRPTQTLKTLQTKLETYRDWLLTLTICDPACGSGAFLNQALDFLIKEHQYIDELQTNLLGGGFVFPDIENTVLENNIFGVDINEESVEIAKLSLWLRTAQPRRKLNDLSSNIKCGNSLIDDKSVAGDKAFKWEDEFSEIFAKGGFDVVIGNPPYVSSKGENFSESIKAYLTTQFNTSVYQIDLYVLFMERSLSLIGKSGKISLIIPNAWLNNLFLKDVRAFLINNSHLEEIVSMPNGTFTDANVDTVILTYSLVTDDTNTRLCLCDKQEFENFGVENQKEWLKNEEFTINITATKEIKNVLSKFKTNVVSLASFTSIGRGVGVYHKRVGHTKELIATDPYQSQLKEDETFVPYLRGKHVQRWHTKWDNNSFISYGNWLAEPREPKFFEGDRIVLRQIPSKRLVATFLNDKFITDQSVFVARFMEQGEWNPQEVLSIINSSSMSFYFRQNYSEFDDLFPKVKLQHFKDFPIPKGLSNSNGKLGLLATLRLEKSDANFIKIQTFGKYIKQHLGIEELPRKLQNWHELDFAEFIKELNKAIKKADGEKLSKSDEMDWMEVFEKKKAEAQTLKAEIDKTDNEIDQMVYELYGLSEEEIKIVEGS
ncbi:MAG: N-6 DNA methylase, partial [Flavobacteriales bacterium]|nr:N-6 DNA methylase [Flavobacteriales bacterium]